MLSILINRGSSLTWRLPRQSCRNSSYYTCISQVDLLCLVFFFWLFQLSDSWLYLQAPMLPTLQKPNINQMPPVHEFPIKWKTPISHTLRKQVNSSWCTKRTCRKQIPASHSSNATKHLQQSHRFHATELVLVQGGTTGDYLGPFSYLDHTCLQVELFPSIISLVSRAVLWNNGRLSSSPKMRTHSP